MKPHVAFRNFRLKALMALALLSFGAYGQSDVVSAYESANGNAAIITLYRKVGDKYIAFALGRVEGRLLFNSAGIVGG